MGRSLEKNKNNGPLSFVSRSKIDYLINLKIPPTVSKSKLFVKSAMDLGLIWALFGIHVGLLEGLVWIILKSLWVSI